VIEAADALVALLLPSVFANGALNPQLARQLAHAQFEVNRVYACRRRFVTRWKRALDDVQRPGETPWIEEIVEEFDDRRAGVVDELVLFLQAMIVRARVTSITAASLAREGDGTTALQLLDRLDDEIRDDSFDLYRRVRALATNAHEAPAWWRKLDRLDATKISWLARDDAADAHALVQKLADEMHTKIGGALPPRDGDVVVGARNDPFLYESAADSA
jgi:hypothetical protein